MSVEDLRETAIPLIRRIINTAKFSFGVAGDFLKLLWPNGVPVESYPDMLCLVRMFDKFKRIATDPTALGEDPYADLVGYSLLNLARVRASK